MKQEAKSEGKSTEDFTDEKLAEQLKKSERQVQKMRELSKKADEQTLDKVASGEFTINQAYSEVKKAEHPKENKNNEKLSINKRHIYICPLLFFTFLLYILLLFEVVYHLLFHTFRNTSYLVQLLYLEQVP
jgi:hypothetical protein